jgi:L-alanine-DL-glutamate epimerase-like enolase superfamily enzyme
MPTPGAARPGDPDALLVKITTDQGLAGWGEAFGHNVIPATKAVIDHMLAPICVGRDPLAIGA